MEDKPGTSAEVNEPESQPAYANKELWTKSLKNMPNITWRNRKASYIGKR